MAQFVKHIRTDLDTTLETYNIGTMVTDDENSRRIYVDLYNHGSEVTASGTVTGIAKLHNNAKYAFSGAIETGKPYVVVPKEACAVAGPVTILIRLTEGTEKTTIGICKGFIVDASDPEAITEGETTVTVEDLIENLDELLAAIEEADAVLNIINCVAVVESTSTASIAYRKGEHFISDGVLYTATDDINEGGTITLTGSGANAEPTKISDELSAMKDNLHIVNTILDGNPLSAFEWLQGRYEGQDDDFSVTSSNTYVTTRCIGNIAGRHIKVKSYSGFIIHEVDIWNITNGEVVHGGAYPGSTEYENTFNQNAIRMAIVLRKSDYTNISPSDITNEAVEIKWISVLNRLITEDENGLTITLP